MPIPVTAPYTRNTIVLKGHDHHDEFICSGSFGPGHLVMMDSSGLVLRATGSGAIEKMFAKEDALQGGTINGTYNVGDLAFVYTANPGDVIQCRLQAGASCTIGDKLLPAGDGSFISGGATGTRLADLTGDTAPVTNTTTETLLGSGYTIPNNFLQVGDVIRIRGAATIPSHNASDTLILKVKIGSLVLYTTGAVTNAAGDIAFFDVQAVVRSIGASGTIVATGFAGDGVPGTATAKPFNTASQTIDTTGVAFALTAGVTATWSAASAADQVVLNQLTVNVDRGNYGPIGVSEDTFNNSAGSTEQFIRIRIL